MLAADISLDVVLGLLDIAGYIERVSRRLGNSQADYDTLCQLDG